MANKTLRPVSDLALERMRKADQEAIWRGECPRCGTIKGTLADLRGHRCPDGTPTRLNEAQDGSAG